MTGNSPYSFYHHKSEKSTARLVFLAFRYFINNNLVSLLHHAASRRGRGRERPPFQDPHSFREGLDVNGISRPSENVNGLVSFPIIHGALSLPVLVIWGGKKERRTSGPDNKDQGLTGAHPTIGVDRLARWTHMATTEMELLHSNIDF